MATRQPSIWFLLPWLIVLVLAASCNPKEPHPTRPDPQQVLNSGMVAWDDVKSYFTWNYPGAPKQETAAGDAVAVVQVDTQGDWEKADSAQMAACPSSDFHHSAVKAYYLSWKNTIIVTYCFREGMPDQGRFQIYYLPVVEIPLLPDTTPQADVTPMSSDAPQETSDTAEQPVAETRDCETQPPPDGLCLDQDSSPPVRVQDLKLFYAHEPAGRTWASHDLQALDRARFLFLEIGKRLYSVNLSDIHPYLMAETRSRLQIDPSRAGHLHGDELYWRGIKPAVLSLDNCKANLDDSTPLSWRDVLLMDGVTIRPRSSCTPLEDLLPSTDDLPIRFGYAFAGYEPDRKALGWLMLKQGRDIAAYPVGFSATPDILKAVRFQVNLTEGVQSAAASE